MNNYKPFQILIKKNHIILIGEARAVKRSSQADLYCTAVYCIHVTYEQKTGTTVILTQMTPSGEP